MLNKNSSDLSSVVCLIVKELSFRLCAGRRIRAAVSQSALFLSLFRPLYLDHLDNFIDTLLTALIRDVFKAGMGCGEIMLL